MSTRIEENSALIKRFKERFFQLTTENVEQFAVELFHFQSKHNEIYRNYLKHLPINYQNIQTVEEIPFLPIRFFKEQKVVSTNAVQEVIYKSSGTGGDRSQHYVFDQGFYLQHAKRLFESYYGALQEYHILALLPSYIAQGDSSLVAMIDYFVQQSQSNVSGFYLDNTDDLYSVLKKAMQSDRKVILLGVTYALLDFVEQYHLSYPDLIVMETGGMKGRRKEMTREEVHKQLTHGFGVQHIHSEYGMTELLSQAYSKGKGIFEPSLTLQLFTRQINDPFQKVALGKQGILKVMDLANITSCAFVETQDLGILHHDRTFEVIGRVDNSDIRGCNLLYRF